jgi:hypothetical protein
MTEKTVTLSNRDKTVSINLPFTNVEEIVVWQYKLSMLDAQEIKTDSDLFKALSDLGEIDSVKDEPCGKCGSHNIMFRVREDDEGNKYHEKICKDCWAKLEFGAHKKPAGSLFAKRRNEDKSPKGKNGWTKWNKEKGIAE